MGWLSYNNTSKKQVVENIKADYGSSMEWSLVGNNLWGLYTVTQKDVDFNPKNELGQKVILLFKIEYFKHNNGYGYKNMCEADHPYYYNCPLKFLKQAKVECQEWRDNVVKFHENARKSRKVVANLKIGDIVKLSEKYKVKEVRIVSTNPLRGASTTSGYVYKITPIHIAV